MRAGSVCSLRWPSRASRRRRTRSGAISGPWISTCWSVTAGNELRRFPVERSTMRFRTKTIVGVALIEIALLAVLVLSALSILRDSNEAALVRRVQLGARLLVVAAKDSVISQDLATLDSLVVEAMGSGQMEYVRILDAHGTVLAQRGDATILGLPFHQEETVDQARDGIFEQSQAVLAGGIRHGEVQIGVSVSSLQVLLASAQRWAAGVAALEILLVALFSWLLGTYLVRQLGALRQASEHFAAGDFEHRVAVKGDDELAQTANAFNAMAQQLSQSREQLQVENSKWRDAIEAAEKAENLLREAVSSIPQGLPSTTNRIAWCFATKPICAFMKPVVI
ncbi:MAG: HAMP domain-containing protein [Comamonadaceae bacterium]|nr:MAG: HAMP domain-containing protein [Comamonadaceae bacterium]